MTNPLGIQLYTLRDQAAEGLAPVLERVARIGYRALEVALLHDLGPAELRRTADGLGLEVASLHGLPFDDAAEGVFDTAEALGASAVVVPALGPPEFESEAAIARSAERLNRAAEAATARSLRLGYHNHFWEWNPLPSGERAFDRLLAALSPEVGIELDVYWAQTAGQEPAAVLRALGSRARWLHLKDGPADVPESAMTAAGEGSVDLAAAVRAAPPDAQAFVELDRCDGDMWQAVEASHAYLTEAGLAG